ncbi:MAG: hypothetical protein RIG62_08145 [Cyclobacteriaceae bacterium]
MVVSSYDLFPVSKWYARSSRGSLLPADKPLRASPLKVRNTLLRRKTGISPKILIGAGATIAAGLVTFR